MRTNENIKQNIPNLLSIKRFRGQIGRLKAVVHGWTEKCYEMGYKQKQTIRDNTRHSNAVRSFMNGWKWNYYTVYSTKDDDCWLSLGFIA